MFLNEVAIGKQHIITQDDSSLTAPPTGYDSVLAKGRQEPGKICSNVTNKLSSHFSCVFVFVRCYMFGLKCKILIVCEYIFKHFQTPVRKQE